MAITENNTPNDNTPPIPIVADGDTSPSVETEALSDPLAAVKSPAASESPKTPTEPAVGAPVVNTIPVLSGTDLKASISKTTERAENVVHPAPRDSKAIRASGSILDTDITEETRATFQEYQRVNQIHTKFPGKVVKEVTLSTILPEYSFVAAQEAGVLKKKPVAKVVGMDWQLSKEPFDTELPPSKGIIVAESLRDEENLQSMRFVVEMDRDEVLYGRYRKYHEVTKKNGEKEVYVDKWSIWNKVDGSQNGIQLSDTLVRTPYARVEIDFIHSERGEVIITGSDFNMFNGPGKHKSTSWRVKSLSGKKIFERARDEDHLTELRLPYEMFKGVEGFEITFRYHTDLNAQSNWSRYVYVNKNGDMDMFNATLDFGIVVGKKAYITIHAYTELFNYADIEIRDENEEVAQALYKVTNRQIIMPTTQLENNAIYKIYVRATMTDGTSTKWKMIKETMAVANNHYNYRPEINYLNKFVFAQEIIMGGAVILATRQRYMGDILGVKHDTSTLNSYVFAGGKLVEQGAVYNFEEKITLPYVNPIQLPNDDVIVNYAIEDSGTNYLSSVFVYLSYNHFKKNYAMRSKLIRTNEKFSTAISHSVAVDPRDTKILYYIPAREVDGENNEMDLSIYKLDYSNSRKLVITQEANLPFKAKRNVNLCYTHDHKLLVFGGTGDKQEEVEKRNGGTERFWKRSNNAIYVYDPMVKRFEVLCLMPENFHSRIYNTQAFLRRDDKVIAFNASSTSTEDTKRFLVIDYKRKTAETFKSDINDRIPFRTTIGLNNGDFLRISTTDHDPQKLFRYAAVSTGENAVYDDEHSKVTEKVLIVKSKDIVAIEDPSIYDTIIISGNNEENTGLLRIVTDHEIYEYNYRNKIITRDTAMTTKEFERWNGLYEIVAWGCDITVSSPSEGDEEYAFEPVGLKPNKEDLHESLLSILSNLKTESISYVTENNYHIKISPKELKEEHIVQGTKPVDVELTELLSGQKLVIPCRIEPNGAIINEANGDVIFPLKDTDTVSYYEVYNEDSPVTVIKNAIMLLNKKPETKDIIAAIVTNDKVEIHDLRLILANLLLDPRKLVKENIIENLKSVVRGLGGEYLKMTDTPRAVE